MFERYCRGFAGNTIAATLLLELNAGNNESYGNCHRKL